MVIQVKWGIYAGIAALLLAFIISILIGHAGFTVSILRGLGFALLFFILGTGAWTLINTFMPELLFPEANDAAANIFGSESSGSQSPDSQSYGSYVNITLGDKSEAALPDSSGQDSDEIGNIADLVSGAINPAEEAKQQRGLDETSKNDYTNSGEDTTPSLNGFMDGLAEPASDSGSFSMNFDNLALGGGLTGEEPFGDSFSIPGDSGGTSKEEVFSLPERKVTGNKPMALEGDFNPKDLAAGIRTVLETDKKG
jgi:hypothetical protein